MKSSRKKNEMRRFFDVVERDTSGLIEKVRRFFGWEKVLNLKPSFYRRYPIRVAAIIIVFLMLSFSNRYFFISAESATFYPTTCLGAWSAVGQAQYQPESAASSDVFINESNAAQYPGNSEGIFCGKFLPDDFESPGVLKNAVLTLVLQVGEAQIPPGQQGIIITSSTTETTASSTEEVTSSTEALEQEEISEEVVEVATQKEATPSTEILRQEDSEKTEEVATQKEESQPEAVPVSEPIVEPQPVDQPASEEAPTPDPTPQPTEVVPPPTDTPTSFLKNWLISAAFAQEELVTEEINEQSSSSEEKVIELGPPIVASLEEVASTTDVVATTTEIIGEAVSSTEAVVPPPPPDEHFLAVNFSFDGQRWQTLARISEKNWNLFTLSLPVSSWEDLRSLQISVEGIETTASKPLPKVFLDGMFVGVQYESSLLDELLDEENKKEKTVKSLRVFPGGDEALMEEARNKIANYFNGTFVISPQFEGNDSFIFNGRVGSSNQIFLFNKTSNEVKQLTNSDSLKSEPAMINGYAAWNEVDAHDRDRYGEVMLYDFSSESVKEITNDRFADHLPYFEENVLVWEKIDAQAQRHVYQYTLSSGDIVQRDTLMFENNALPENTEE